MLADANSTTLQSTPSRSGPFAIPPSREIEVTASLEETSAPSSTDFPPISVREMHLRFAVGAAGNAVWRGMFPAIHKNGVLISEPLVLFTSKESGSGLGLPLSKISAHAIRTQVSESDALFASYQERAATFILRNFNRNSKSMGLRVLVRE